MIIHSDNWEEKIMTGNKEAYFYLASSLEKIFPDTDCVKKNDQHTISIFKGELPAFLLVYGSSSNYDGDRKRFAEGFTYEIKGSPSPVRVRDVELVPSAFPCYEQTDEWYLKSQPGLFPDLLCPRETNFVRLIPGQTRSLWIDFLDTSAIVPGTYQIDILIYGKDEKEPYQILTVNLNVLDKVLSEQTLIHTEWFHADCLADYYHIPVFSEKHWEIMEAQIALAGKELGINMLLTPIFTPPLDTAVGGERTTVQLIDIVQDADGSYKFDWSRLKRWCDLCLRNGIKYLEIPHLFTQWGAKAAPKIVVTVDGKNVKKFGWHTPALDSSYQSFLKQFLPELQSKLIEFGYDRDHVFFHISDEPGMDCLESYKAARESVKESLKGWQVVDALSEYSFYEKGIVQHPIVSSNHISVFLKNKMPQPWVYYCCGQSVTVPNRFFAMPSWRNRIMGVLMYLHGIKGFLHWGFNFYNSQYSISHIDPFFNTHASYAFPSGDAFLVYPGPDEKPMSSIRAQVQREALDDLNALTTLESVVGRERVVALIMENAEEPFDFEHYPHLADYILHLRERMAEIFIQEEQKY